MSGRRKTNAPQRIGSLQEHDRLLSERAAVVPGGGSSSSPPQEEGDIDGDDDRGFLTGNSGGGMFARRREVNMADQDEEEEEEEDYLYEDGDDEGELDELLLRYGTPQAGSKRRRASGGNSSSGLTVSPYEKKPRKTRRRLRREGRLMALPEEEEEDGDQEKTRYSNFFTVAQTAQAKENMVAVFVPLPPEDASCRALLLHQWVFPLPLEPPVPKDVKLASYIIAVPDGRRYFCIADAEDLPSVYVKEEVSSGLGVKPGFTDLLVTSLYDLKKPLITIEAHTIGQGSQRQFHLNLYLTEEAVQLAPMTNVPPATTKALMLLRDIMDSLFFAEGRGERAPASPSSAPSTSPSFEAATLYSMLEDYKAGCERTPVRSNLHFPQLKVTLRPYQEDGVQWMIAREEGKPYFKESHSMTKSTTMPLGWVRLPLPEGSSAPFLYYNRYAVAMSLVSPLDDYDDQQPSVLGGILADEMGLGKTVEVLGLIHAHKYQPRRQDPDGGVDETKESSDGSSTTSHEDDDSMQTEEEEEANEVLEKAMCVCGRQPRGKGLQWVECKKCNRWCHLACTGLGSLEEAKKVSFTCQICRALQYFAKPPGCGATLIVCPHVILSQWDDEIHKHSQPGSLKVIKYPGVKEATQTKKLNLLDPDFLASHDVVLTTFDVLNSDLSHTDNTFVSNKEGKIRLRGIKRYSVMPSPLACLTWWRVVLDEAQMVESSTTAAAKMALCLHTVNRWCVSGTPIYKGQASPYDMKGWWVHAIERPIEALSPGAMDRLLKLLAPLMWRTSKARVKDQLGLPDQTEVIHRLSFSNVELHYYRTQHAECARAVLDGLRRAQAEDDDVVDLTKCGASLLRLRQACCHPQVGAGGIRSTENRIMTMEEIHDKLVDDCKNKCEEAQRLFIMNMAGVAALSRIQATLQIRSASNSHQPRMGPVSMIDLYLADACRSYEKTLLVSEANRKPIPVLGIAEVDGNTRGFKRTLNDTDIALTWEGVQPEDAMMVDGPQIVKLEQPVWARILLTSAKKVMGFRLWLPSLSDALQCKECRLYASKSHDGQMMVEVATVDIQELPMAGNNPHERLLTGLDLFKSKIWKLEVLSVVKPDPGKGKGRAAADHLPHTDLQLKVQLLMAEIDVDALQVLHITQNLADVLEQVNERNQVAEAPGGGGGSSRSSGRGSSSSEVVEGAVISRSGAAMDYTRMKTRPMVERIKFLRDKGAVVRAQYLEMPQKLFLSSQQHMVLAETALTNQREKAQTLRVENLGNGLGDIAWWQALLAEMSRTADNTSKEDLLEAVRKARRGGAFPVFHDLNGLNAAMSMHYGTLMDARKDVLRKLKGLGTNPSDKAVKENSNCGVCRKDWGKTGPRCGHCVLSNQLSDYENLLIHYRQKASGSGKGGKGPSKDVFSDHVLVLEGVSFTNTTKGNAFAEEPELFNAFNALRQWLKAEVRKSNSKNLDLKKSLLAEAEAEAQMWNLLKKELGCGLRTWLEYEHMLESMDELDCALITMRLAEDEDGELTEELKRLVVRPEEISMRRQELQNEVSLYEGELKDSQRQLNYLRSLAAGKGSKSEKDDEECPVCITAYTSCDGKTVLKCGHRVCKTCVKSLLTRGHGVATCPVCRYKSKRVDVKEVLRTGDIDDDAVMKDLDLVGSFWGPADGDQAQDGEEPGEEENLPVVRGSWGTKVTALVAQALNLDSEEKCLIFSTWDDMLDVVQQALLDNGLRHVRLKGKKKTADVLEQFKNDPDVKCLLLPLKSGSMGLTLVEATHCFLLEPVLNPFLEAQAINRLHRIGQDKPTKVHRFIVRGTIEEKVEELRMHKLQAAGGFDAVLNSAQRSKGKKGGEEVISLEDFIMLFQARGGRAGTPPSTVTPVTTAASQKQRREGGEGEAVQGSRSGVIDLTDAMEEEAVAAAASSSSSSSSRKGKGKKSLALDEFLTVVDEDDDED